MLPVLFCIAPALLLPFILPQLHLPLSELSPYCNSWATGFLSLSLLVCLQLMSWNGLPLSDLSLSHSQLQSLAALGLLPMLLWCCGLVQKATLSDRCFDSALVLPGCPGDTQGTLELAQMGEMSAEIYQRSHTDCGRKILVPCLFHPTLSLQFEMLQGAAIPGVSDLHNIIQLSSVLALPSVEGCVRKPGVSGLASSSEELGLHVHMAAPELELLCLVRVSGNFSWRKKPKLQTPTNQKSCNGLCLLCLQEDLEHTPESRDSVLLQNHCHSSGCLSNSKAVCNPKPLV